MKTRLRTPLLAALLPLLVLSAGCNTVRAKAAFKDGNRFYKEENYRKAIPYYERAIALSPDFAEAHFYLASSNQSLYRPGKEGDDNKQRLDQAVEHYEKSLEFNKGGSPNLQQLRINTLGALTAMYADPPLTNYEKAIGFAEQLVKDNPNDAKNLYAMANLYEKFNRVSEAEQTYVKVTETNPNDAKACGALAAFYNKPLWDEQGSVWVENQSKGPRRAKFTSAIATLEKCANLDAKDPSGFYKLSMFYWDKAYRDPLIGDKEKDEFADKGLAAVNTALGMKPDYWEAIITKGLLFRVKAQVTRDPKLRKQYLDQAVLLQKQAMDLRKETQAAAAGAAGAAGEVPPEATATPNATKK
jgi:tetratricopeptide (TPR) repeat protein